MRLNREVRQVIDQLGVQVVSIEPGGKHLKVRLRAPDGREMTTTERNASTNMDRRTLLNFRANLRRWLREGRAA